MSAEDPDYIAAVGQEMAAALDPDYTHDLVPHDACDAFFAALGTQNTRPEALSALTSEDLARVAVQMEAMTEVPVTPAILESAISRILRRWPPEPDRN